MLRATVCALVLTLPVGTAAQQLHIAPFTGRNAGLGGATMVGLGVAAYGGPVGVRLSGAMEAGATPLGPVFGRERTDGVDAWSGDVDMVVDGAAMGLRVGGLEPVAFAGVGAHGLRLADGSTAAIPTWSYGLGASLPLTSWLAIDGEARYRMPHESDPDQLPAGVAGGWELRTGLSVRLGRARRPGRAVPAPSGRVGTPVGATAVASLTLRTADRYVGVPYVWGGDSPSEGFDCSGFVQYVFARNDIRLPRVSRDQARAGRRIEPVISRLREGDLLFFAGADGVIDHVAIYVGDRTIIHAASSRGAVAYDRWDSRAARWYADHFVAARRVIPDGIRFRP
jgi:cell wall-associated NlpC family hydrolase